MCVSVQARCGKGNAGIYLVVFSVLHVACKKNISFIRELSAIKESLSKYLAA